MLERLDYYWGLFDEPEIASPEGANKRASFRSPEIPDVVVNSFETERIGDLEGEFGMPGVGKPTEIDHFEYVVESRTRTIRVFNRGISLFQQETPELLRLHRFFCVFLRLE